MIEAFLYVRDESLGDEHLGRLIMHRHYKDSDTGKVLKYMEQYIEQEKLNLNKEILIRVLCSDAVVRHDLDLRDYK